MNVMIIFNVVILGFGIYMIAAALKMKKTGEISSAVITEEEIAKCKDKRVLWISCIGGKLLLV